MATYRELQAEIERLQQEAQVAREAEKSAVIEQIRQMIVEYRIYPQELGVRLQPQKDTSRSPRPAKYRDPATGATWSGAGRAPRWMDGKNREDFAV